MTLQVPVISGGSSRSSQVQLQGRAGIDRVGAVPGSAATGRAGSEPAPTNAVPRSGATPLREPGLQQRLGSLQQGAAYLDELGRTLQELKNGLSQSLARPGTAATAGLADKLQALQLQWNARAAEGGGALDATLQVVPEGETTRQRFRLRGLDLNSLAAAGTETLRLALPGQARSIAVPLDGRGLQPALQTLQRALAPTGLRVDTSGGSLQFSVAEADWPALRDGLGIKGDGKRFPSGQTVRALLDPAADALTPGAWRIDSPEAQRRSLVQLLQAQQQLGQARQQLEQQLNAASSSAAQTAAAAQGGAAEAEALAVFAAEFARAPQEATLDYGRLSALAPALLGLHRAQVQQLLLPAAAQG